MKELIDGCEGPIHFQSAVHTVRLSFNPGNISLINQFIHFVRFLQVSLRTFAAAKFTFYWSE